MDKPKKKRRTAPNKKIQVTVRCLFCKKSFPKSYLEVGVMRTKICCGGLNKHLSSQSRRRCQDHYAKNYMKNGDFDFYPSLISQDEQLYSDLFSSKRNQAIDFFFLLPILVLPELAMDLFLPTIQLFNRQILTCRQSTTPINPNYLVLW